MRLLYINYEFPPLGGGGGRANAQIAREMAAMGHEVRVLTSSFRGAPAHETRDGYRIRRIPSLRRHQEKSGVLEMAVFMVVSVFYALRLAARWKPDCCVAFFTIPSGPAAWAVKLAFKIPYVVSLRGGDVPGFMGDALRFYHRLTKPLIRFLWKRADAVVANSLGLRELALRTGPDLDIAMIPNGVDASFFASRSRAQVDESVAPSDQALRLLTVGRLSSQKGIEYLLQALQHLKPRLSRPVRVSLAGEGPKRQELEGLADRLGVRDMVAFLGWQEPDALKALYREADLFVFPSLDEGMPNAVLEAMAMGLPVVGTDIAGTRELIRDGENGRLVPAADSARLAQALEAVIRDDAGRARMARNSRERARQYDWKTVAQGYEALCRKARAAA